jgi:hypothetical protein
MAVGADTLSTGQPLEASEVAGSWSNPSDLSGVQTLSFMDGVSCSDASDCTAVGEDDANTEPIYATYSGGAWSSYQDFLSTPPSGNGFLYSVSCWSAGNCTAVGYDQGFELPYYINESAGTWDPSGGTDVSPPAAVDISRPLVVLTPPIARRLGLTTSTAFLLRSPKVEESGERRWTFRR